MKDINVTVRRDKDAEYELWEARAYTKDSLFELSVGTGGSRREAVTDMLFRLELNGD